ncbi:MAG: LUD domain-containing protein [Niastella sp.]|nr:LUD domain-containing protein [Niastella sp.]
MQSNQAKENILKKIREALSHPVPLPYSGSEGQESVFTASTEDDTVTFAEEFTKLQGKFIYCTNEEILWQQLQSLLLQQQLEKIYCTEPLFLPALKQLGTMLTSDLAHCDASITGCEYLVARTGSIVLSAAQATGRTASVYAPVHICIAYNHQLLYDIKNALQFLKEKYKDHFPSLITFASGPSRTADIEKTLVTGVHGPKEVYCFLVEG